MKDEHSVSFLREHAKSLSILILEDNENARDILTRIVKPFFALCVSAQNGAEALCELEKNSFDVILADINLPDMNGLDFLKLAKTSNINSHFVVVSGYDSSEYFLKSIDLGVDSFIVKPIAAENLLYALYKIVSKIDKQKNLESNRLELAAAHEQTSALLEMQDRFIKDALHEINTPLAVIMATLELLENKCPERALLERIDAASRTLKNNFEDLIYHTLDGKAQIKADAIDLGEFIKSRIEYFGPIISANALQINFSLSDEKCMLSLIPIKLQRLIDNNLSNAIKYSYRNPGKIIVTLLQENGCCILRFQNYGPKIEDVHSIFNRFYREKPDYMGYGIGLGIVKQICDEEDISINVESSSKNGSIFTYKFNLKGK